MLDAAPDHHIPRQALVGVEGGVGSQVGVIVTPEDGYGDQANAKIPAGSTLFFVVDILGVL